MRRLITRHIQFLILNLSYLICCTLFSKHQKKGWVVVGVETATVLKNISQALPDAVSVNFAPHRFYDFDYDYELYSKGKLSRFKNDLLSAYLLGYLMSRYERFVYLGDKGFLINNRDGRAKEFKFLKRKNKSLTCYFLGSEIRSFNLLNEYARAHNIDVATTYQGISNPGLNSTKKENIRKKAINAYTAAPKNTFNASPLGDSSLLIYNKSKPKNIA